MNSILYIEEIDMNKINIILPEYANPVPPIYGGAIEELIDLLVQENRINKEFDILVHVPIKDKKTLHLLKKSDDINYIYVNSVFSKLFNFFVIIINKIFRELHLNKIVLNYYYWKINTCLNGKKNILIFEGDYKDSVSYFSKKYGRKNLYYHVHSQILNKRDISLNFGHIISVSEFIENDWKSYLLSKGVKYHILKNAVNHNKFEHRITEKKYYELRKQLGFDEDDFIVMFCGRIIPEKGILELLKAFNLIDKNDIKLLIIGSPNFAIDIETEYLKEVQDIVNKNNAKIKFTGYVPNDTLYQYYQISDIQVIPSMWEEAAGLVAIEGMISKLPLIVTQSGGLVEYVNSDCAIILKKDKQLIENISNSIIELYQDKVKLKKMSESGFLQSQKFTKQMYYLDFLKVFR